MRGGEAGGGGATPRVGETTHLVGSENGRELWSRKEVSIYSLSRELSTSELT